jgi:hypothetical protein
MDEYRKAIDESAFLSEVQKINARQLLNEKAVNDLLHPKPTTPKHNATLELIAQSIKLRRQIVDAVGGPAAQAIIEQSIKTKRMARDALKAGAGIGVVPMPDFPKTPLAVEMQRAEENRRLSLAAAEGEARARAEFKTRLELEAAHQKELQATTVTLPPPAPAPATESIADRNARWLAIFDQEERSKPNGAQTRTCQKVSEQEGALLDTVKKALQNAKAERRERYRQGGAIPLPKKKGKPKITANNPFGLATQKS